MPHNPSPSHPARASAARSVWLVAVGGALILTGLFAWGVWYTYHHTLADSRTTRESLARIADAQISGHLRAVDNMLLDIRETVLRHGPNSPTLNEQLRDFKRLFPELASTGVLDAQGVSVASSNQGIVGNDLSQRSYFSFHIGSGKDSFFLSEPFDSVIGTRNMVASRSILSPDGSFLGVATAVLRTSFFENILKLVVPDRNGSVVLLGRDFIIRMRVPNPEKFIGKSVKGLPYTEGFLASGQRQTEYRVKATLDTVERFVTFRALDYPPNLLLVISESTDDVLAPWGLETAVNGFFTLGGVALILLLAFMASRGARKTHAALQERQRKDVLLSTLLQNLPVEVWARDMTGRIIFQSEPSHALWGDLRGRPLLSDTLPSSTLQAWKERNARAMAGESVHLTAEEELPGGGKRVCDIFVGPIRHGGEVTGILGVNVDITEKLRLECDLFTSEQKYKSFVEGGDDIITSVDDQGRLLFVNRRGEEFFGKPAAALLGGSAFDLVHPDDRQPTMDAFRNWKGSSSPHLSFENRLLGATGRTVPFLWTVTPFFSPSGTLLGFNSVARDITGLKAAQETVSRSLEEKEVMLKEIHHRVKNNLQIILSLISLQGASEGDLHQHPTLSRTYGRIRAMALVHEQLYRADDLTRVDLPAYVPALVQNISGAMGGRGPGIRLELDLAPVSLRIEQAIPFGLLVNELVTNAHKHAFSAAGEGRLSIRLANDEQGQTRLTVADDGPGLPPGFSLQDQTSLGSQLILALAQQLGGMVETASDGGATFVVTFRVEN